MKYRTGIGQDSHRFLKDGAKKKCIIAGIPFEDVPGMDADSDGDVVFHAICNAMTSLTHVPILGKIALDLCRKEGITDSRVYLDQAYKALGPQKIEHVALTIEGQRPKLQHWADNIRQSVAKALYLSIDQVGVTFTSGDSLTAFGKGEGLMCFCILTTIESTI
ncbi:MAG: 2-C-methyl-D-erythritol 2,4-cyclodiphosphate synthase [Simkaniaceae bacterium]|nr:2-C-methyl-D-erythritol 2,4-cyclodiphosphate synthase [Simkaniaceae bacterium]